MNKTKVIILLLAIIIGICSLIYYRNDDESKEIVENNEINETKIVLYFSKFHPIIVQMINIKLGCHNHLIFFVK